MNRTCKECVHFAPASEAETQTKALGKFVDLDACGVTAQLLEPPVLTEAEAKAYKSKDVFQREVAEACAAFAWSGEDHELPQRGEVDGIVVVAVTLSAFQPSKYARSTPEALEDLNSCLNCDNLVAAVDARDRHGISVPICIGTGDLILKQSQAVKGCGLRVRRQAGPSAAAVNELKLITSFQRGYDQFGNNVAARAMTSATKISTDVEVTDEDKARGIAGWRVVEDPEGVGRPVKLPVFSIDVVREQDRELIPQGGDAEHPDLYQDYSGIAYQFAVDSWTLGETLCLVGEPGLGKTEAGRYLAYLMAVPFHRFSFNAASEVDDMIGKTLYSPDTGTYWQNGRVTEAVESLGLLMMDELNLAPDECKQFMRPLMDNSRQMILDRSNGRRVTLHPESRIMVSINPAWDIRNAGAVDFADAETNRMSFAFIGWPDVEVEKDIIRKRCELDGFEIQDDDLNRLVAIGQDIREAGQQGLFPGSWGIRQQIKVARKLNWYGLERAIRQASLNYYEPNVVDEIMGLVASH